MALGVLRLKLELTIVTRSQRHQKNVYLHTDLLDELSRKDHHICSGKNQIKHGYLAATSADDAAVPDNLVLVSTVAHPILLV